MKKMLLLALVASFMTSGCSKVNNVVEEPKPTPEPEPKQQEPRTINVSKGINADQTGFNYSYDFDSDGNDEMIKIDVPEYEEYTGNDYIDITIGDYNQKYDIMEGVLEEVYVCDLDVNDGKKDLAIITCEVSGDPRIRILSYSPNLPAYHFYNEWLEEAEDCLWLGYAVNYYFNVNDDDSITVEKQTPSTGMWSVYGTFSRDKSGVFAEEKPEYYEILADFMEDSYAYIGEYDYISGKEREMWGKGYIKAYKTLTSKSFTINEGEYFRVPYDAGNNEIYIEKENGEASWVKVDYNTFYDLNQYFFYMAG